MFGSTTLAISTVLATFMGGLGLGSYLAGRFADRIKNPVRAYALAEAGDRRLRAAGAADPRGVPGAQPAGCTACSAIAFCCCRWCASSASAVLLLIPTTLMGATLPLLARHFVTRPWELRRSGLRIGTLYAVNLFGAVAGAFFAGFVFLPLLGVTWTNVTAASFNLTLAAAIILARRRLPAADEGRRRGERRGAPGRRRPSQPQPRDRRRCRRRPWSTRASRRAALAAFAVSGATAMTLAGAVDARAGGAARLVGVLVHADPAGVPDRPRRRRRRVRRARASARRTRCAGSRRCTSRPRPRSALTYLFTDRIPYVFTWLLQSTSFGVDAILFCQFVLACITVLPATMLMGGVFPLTVRIATGGARLGRARRRQRLRAQHAGRDRRVVPVGVRRAAQAGAAARASTPRCCATWRWRRCCSAVAPGLTAAPPLGGRRRRRRAGAARAWCCRAGTWCSFSSGFFRVSIAREYIYAQDPQARLEDAQAGVLRGRHRHHRQRRSVGQDLLAEEQRQGRRVERRRHADADHRRPAAVPVLQPAARRPRSRWSATARASPPARSRSTRSRRSRWSSWSRPSTAASRFFDNDNHRPLQNPKVTARVGDGRNFLTQRSDKFDVIVSEPSNPWLTGVSNLFTREYFQLRQDPPRASTASSASGRSSTRWRPGTSRPSTAPCATSSPTSTCSRPRTVVGHDPDRQPGSAAAGLRRRRRARSAIR